MRKSNLDAAKRNKKDEFYTRIEDIENELKYYKNHFKNKVIYCNCDKFTGDHISNFYNYFTMNFKHLGLKKLICSYYNEGGNGKAVIFEGIKDPTIITLNGDGSFDSDECKEFMRSADIIVTNPPFSLFRPFIAQIMEMQKQFIVLGNMNAITYKETFKWIKENKLWAGFGFNKTMEFVMPNSYEKFNRIENGKKIGKVPAICWFTNIPIKKRFDELPLYKSYNPTDYPTYDNYEAIECGKVNNIPCDYDGIMGVPISFLDKYNPNQFEIIGGSGTFELTRELGVEPINQDFIDKYKTCGGKRFMNLNTPLLAYYTKNEAIIPYARILIRKKK